MSKPYMPLMMGDWIRGTRGMRADVKGVYIGLLIHQYDSGYLPADLEELALIEPEVVKVWVKLKEKFFEFEPGKLQNKKLEEVRAFWNKQGNNGKKGGRPKKEKPNNNPTINPKHNPNTNHHNDLDLEYDIELILKSAFDEIYMDSQKMKWPHLDFPFEYNCFCEKVRGSPSEYSNRDSNSIRLAFQYQLRNSKGKKNGHSKNKQSTADLAQAFAVRVMQNNSGQQFSGDKQPPAVDD